MLGLSRDSKEDIEKDDSNDDEDTANGLSDEGQVNKQPEIPHQDITDRDEALYDDPDEDSSYLYGAGHRARMGFS